MAVAWQVREQLIPARVPRRLGLRSVVAESCCSVTPGVEPERGAGNGHFLAVDASAAIAVGLEQRGTQAVRAWAGSLGTLAPNCPKLLERDFRVEGPNRVWVDHRTDVGTAKRWACLDQQRFQSFMNPTLANVKLYGASVA